MVGGRRHGGKDARRGNVHPHRGVPMPGDVVPIGCVALDQLLGGGVEAACLTLLYGVAGSGKTNVCLQVARNVARDEKRGLYVDTEGVSLERLRQMWGDDFEQVLGQILMSEPYSNEEQ